MFEENFDEMPFNQVIYKRLKMKTYLVITSAIISAVFTICLLTTTLLACSSTLMIFSLLNQISAVAFFYSSIFLSITFYIWIYSFVKATRELGIQQKYKPFKVLIFFFIPILNLFKPYIDMRNIWLSIKDRDVGFGHYTILKFWWAFFIMSAIILKAAWQLSFLVETFDELIISIKFDIVSLIINLLYCAITLLLISDYWHKFKYVYMNKFVKIGGIK